MGTRRRVFLDRDGVINFIVGALQVEEMRL